MRPGTRRTLVNTVMIAAVIAFLTVTIVMRQAARVSGAVVSATRAVLSAVAASQALGSR